MTPRGCLLLALAAASFALPASAAAPPPADTAPVLARSIDRLLADHWKQQSLTPASAANDLTLLRRVTIDLAGRVPTPAELDAFAADHSGARFATAVHRLMRGPEFAAHFATVLDELIQGRTANDAFAGYLRRALVARKGWDVVFREVMVGPWTDEDRKPARLFLERRARDLDVMTVDVTRAFFGVDVSCARCHNHPLVKDWKREHYYGMAAFLVRTTGGKGNVGEKLDGEAKFAGKDGKERVIPMMFLSGKRLQDPPRPKSAKDRFSRRDALVRLALEEKHFFAGAFVNRVWEYLLGRGLVDPPDQMHSANPASVPALLDHLAAGFVANGHDVQRLVAGVVLSRAYRLDGRWPDENAPAAGHFAVARLRPLSPRQLSRSLVVALGDGSFAPLTARLVELDKQATALTPDLDPRARDFQSSTREALFVSNAEAVRKLVAGEGNLAARLATTGDDRELLCTAFRAILSRPPSSDELAELSGWLKRQGGRRAACEDLVWALAASAEFRFNH